MQNIIQKDAQYNELFSLISSFIPMKEDDRIFIRSLFHPCKIKKDAILIDTGEFVDKAYFISSGFLRYFKDTESGEEQTIHLMTSGHFATSFCSFLMRTKSEEKLQAITDTELLYITKNDLEQLYKKDTKYESFGRKLMQSFLLEKEQRIIDQLSMSAQNRYLKLLKTDPEMIQQVPIQYIASYIGIQHESLSRIRKQIFLTNVK